MKNQINMENKECYCGVPNNIHGTCCGWNNASFPVDESGVISEPMHPYCGKHLNEWLSRDFKPVVRLTILFFMFTTLMSWTYAQNSPPKARNDSFYNRVSGNVLKNDSDPNNDALTMLYYFVDGVKYTMTAKATANPALKAKYGTVYFQTSGNVYSDTNITIQYVIGDGHKWPNGRLVADTAICQFSSKWAKKRGPIVKDIDSVLLNSAFGVMIYPKPYSGNCTFPYTRYNIEMKYRDTVVWYGYTAKGQDIQGTASYPVYYVWCESTRGPVSFRISEAEFNLIASKGCRP